MTKKKRKRKKYKIINAEVCMRCEAVTVRDGGGIVPFVCQKCYVELRKIFKVWNKTGIYLTRKQEDLC